VTRENIKEHEIGGTCSTHKTMEKCTGHFSRKTWREK